MDTLWKKLYQEARYRVHPTWVSSDTYVGEKIAAVMSHEDSIFFGCEINTFDPTTIIYPEQAAIAAMLTRSNKAVRMLTIDAAGYVVPPSDKAMQFLSSLGTVTSDLQILIDYDGEICRPPRI